MGEGEMYALATRLPRVRLAAPSASPARVHRRCTRAMSSPVWVQEGAGGGAGPLAVVPDAPGGGAGPEARPDLRGAWNGLSGAESAGTPQGHSPKELLLASLGLCTCMTLRAVADGRGLPLAHCAVRVAEAPPPAPGRHVPAALALHIQLTGPGLTDAHVAALRRAADACPVHAMIATPIATTVHVVRDA